MKRTITILVLAFVGIFAAKAQLEITVADGAQTGYYPVNSEKLLSRPVTLQTQMLYPASMLTALLNSDITKMVFHSPTANETWGGIRL